MTSGFWAKQAQREAAAAAAKAEAELIAFRQKLDALNTQPCAHCGVESADVLFGSCPACDDLWHAAEASAQ